MDRDELVATLASLASGIRRVILTGNLKPNYRHGLDHARQYLDHVAMALLEEPVAAHAAVGPEDYGELGESGA